MNKNDFLKGLESKDIIQLIENDGTKELVFTEKNTIATVEKRFHHKNIVFNDLKDFVKFSNNQDDGTVIYNFKENKIYHTQQMQLEMEKEILSVDWFAPIRTDEFNFWAKQEESNLKKFLNKLSLVADKDEVKNIRLMFAEFEIGERTDARNESMIVKTIKNTLKNLPEVLTIRFNPYMFVNDFQIEIEIYLEWNIDSQGFKSVKWDFEDALVKNLFYEHLKSEVDLDFIIGEFSVFEESYIFKRELSECKEEKKDDVKVNIDIDTK